MTETPKKSRGGYRPGAGRKRVFAGMKMRSWRVPEYESRLLEAWAQQHGCTESEALRQMIRKAAGE